jgi:hypothetical protein
MPRTARSDFDDPELEPDEPTIYDDDDESLPEDE